MEAKEISNIISSLKKKYPIVSALRQKGVNLTPLDEVAGVYTGMCPFCKSKAFLADSKTNLFKCFNPKCRKQGNIIDLAVAMQETSYTEALKLFTKDTVDNENEELREKVYAVNKYAAEFFIKSLRKNENAANYIFSKRKLSEQSVSKFGIGYAPQNGASHDGKFLSALTLKFGVEAVKASKLFNDYGHCIFNGRIIFPITDICGRIIGFGGRALSSETRPKYLNSPDTVIFNKREQLYGLSFLLDKPLKNIIVCEGYMDAIAMQQAGYAAVASLGTAFTPEQCALIKKYTVNAYSAYDFDSAGKNATVKAINLFEKNGISMKIMDFSPYKDADEYIRTAGADSFAKLFQRAISKKQWVMRNK